MNYNYLRYFSVLAQVEHYTLAAARLGISQPSLSSAIHHLETELGGVKLFEKVGRNIRLTEEGPAGTEHRIGDIAGQQGFRPGIYPHGCGIRHIGRHSCPPHCRLYRPK